MTDKLTLGHVSTLLTPCDLPDGSGQFLYFNLNNMPEFVEEGARLVAERCAALKLKNAFFVTPETSTISMAHVLRTKYNIDGIVISKRKKPDDNELESVSYCAATSTEARTLYLDKSIDLKGKDLIIFDNVCTTGETLKAVAQLLIRRGWKSQIVESIVLYTEGKEWKELQVSSEFTINVHAFGHLPILPNKGKNIQFIHFSSTNLPTSIGTIEFHVFKHRLLEKEVIVCAGQNTFVDKEIQFVDGKWKNIAVRVHDACITSEAFGSVKCDCRLQLKQALQYIHDYGGLVIYMPQEGRGIGLANKIAAYNLQETKGLDTVDANRQLNLPDDAREYQAVVDVLNHFSIDSVMLMTNNNRKIVELQKLGVCVSGRIPAVVCPKSTQMRKYMTDKAKRMGHKIPLDV